MMSSSPVNFNLAFCSPIVLCQYHTTRFLAQRLPVGLPISRRTVKRLSRSQTKIVAQWREQLLPSDPDSPSLNSLYANFPTKFLQAFLLGVDTEDSAAYVTGHDELTNRRPSYATSSFALPLPLPAPIHQSTMFLRDFFSYTYATPCLDSRSFSATNASFVIRLLPPSVRHYLAIDHIAANDLAMAVQAEISDSCNCISTVLALLRAKDTRVAGAAITEAPSTVNKQICLAGFVYLEKCITSLYGEKVFSDPEPVSVDPHFAVAIANATDSHCFVQKDIFNRASLRVHDMANVFGSYGYRKVQIETQKAEHVPLFNEDVNCIENDPIVGKVWQLTAEDVLALSDDQLRLALRKENVPIRSNESRQSLLGKIIDFMDEVHRRELGIKMAADQEMYDVAAKLQKGRSRRGKLLADLRQAEQIGNWNEVTKLAAEMKQIEARAHDVTLEPGSYDPDLDQDDWYRPCR